MKYRNLGKSGITISEIGFGAWGIGGQIPGKYSYGITDDLISLEALREALDCGINFYDTANIYGNGHSEELLGKAFYNVREQVVIATKCGLQNFESEPNFSQSAIVQSVDSSLRRLNSDYIDLLQLHDPHPNFADNEVLIHTLVSLRSSGKIRAFGVSVKSPSDGLHFVSGPWESIQCNLNMIDLRALESGLLTKSIECNIAIIARTPLAFGFLSGLLTHENLTFPENDHRSRWSQTQLLKWATAPEVFSKINVSETRSLSQLAIKFCTSLPGITSVIPGMLTASEVIENAAVSKIPDLTKDEINQIIDSSRAFESFINP